MLSRTIYETLRCLALVAALLFLYSLFLQRQIIVGTLDTVILLPFAIGAGAFVIVYLAVLRNRLKFWEVFLHELTHVLFVLLTFNKIRGFNVSESSGTTSYDGKSNWLVRIAPYCFPILTIALMLLSSLISQDYHMILMYLVVLSYVWYLMATVQQFTFRGSDIKGVDIVFSPFFILAMNLFLTLAVAYFLQGSMGNLIVLAKDNIRIWEAVWGSIIH